LDEKARGSGGHAEAGERGVTSAQLRELVQSFLDGAIDAATFCRRFEHAFNFDVDRASLSDDEEAAFALLFQEAAYYSPFPRDQWEYPAYRDAAEIRAAAATCLQSI
jgi:hypothetical protein